VIRNTESYHQAKFFAHYAKCARLAEQKFARNFTDFFLRSSHAGARSRIGLPTMKPGLAERGDLLQMPRKEAAITSLPSPACQRGLTGARRLEPRPDNACRLTTAVWAATAYFT
jgi:hypothetical protein